MSSVGSSEVKRLAFEAGFDLCGITSPETIPEARRQYYEWLEKKYHGGMAHLARKPEQRTQPKLLMPWARSMIVLGLNYYQGNSGSVPSGYGRVSRYARGQDYHKVVAKLIRALIRRIREVVGENPSCELTWYVDYGPLLERAYAERAGLGFIGKNGMLINRQFGSWIFLSEIVTSLDLRPYNQPTINHDSCGACRLCIDACPTGAIVADRTIDASKCISYLTVERPGEIPRRIARQMGEMVFGCDICQEVCPHNSRAVVTSHTAFLPDGGVGEFLDAHRVLRLTTREEFLELVAGTPLVRPKLQGLQRNARIVLENEGDIVID